MSRRHHSKPDLLVVLVLFVVINAFSQLTQQPLTFNHGQGWDGAVYYRAAQQFAHHELPVGEPPYIYRIGTPWLVAQLFEGDLLRGFKLVNIAANFICTILFVFWLRLYLRDWRIRVLVAALFLVAWQGPVRFVYYYPVLCDYWLYVVLLAGLLAIHKTRQNPTLSEICVVGAIALVGVAVREVAAMIPVAFLFSGNPIVFSRDASFPWILAQVRRAAGRVPLLFFLPLGLAVLGLMGVWHVATQSSDYYYSSNALFWSYNKPLMTYLHAWFISFGPILVVPLYYWRETCRFLARNQFLLVYLVGLALLAWVGGTDTERLLYWSMPVVYLLIGRALENHEVFARVGGLPLVLLTGQLVSERVFWTIPDYPKPFVTPFPILTLPSSEFQYLDLYSVHGQRGTQQIALLEYVVFAVVLLVWLNYWEWKGANRTRTAAGPLKVDDDVGDSSPGGP